MERKIVEICCGSYYDAVQAAKGGARRIELNSALHLGGLTPTLSTLRMVKRDTDVKAICMVRPRGAGFHYMEAEFTVMLEECRTLVENGADGIAFGCLDGQGRMDRYRNEKLVDIIKSRGKEAVFHRAFDCCRDPFGTMEELIGMGVDRVLTSGQKPKAVQGAALLKELQDRYGDQIQILPGSGINSSNARRLMEETGLWQVHSSCKAWLPDATTTVGEVSYRYGEAPYEDCYDVVSRELVEELIRSIEDGEES